MCIVYTYRPSNSLLPERNCCLYVHAWKSGVWVCCNCCSYVHAWKSGAWVCCNCCLYVHVWESGAYVYVACPRQDSMSSATALSGTCNRFVGRKDSGLVGSKTNLPIIYTLANISAWALQLVIQTTWTVFYTHLLLSDFQQMSMPQLLFVRTRMRVRHMSMLHKHLGQKTGSSTNISYGGTWKDFFSYGN